MRKRKNEEMEKREGLGTNGHIIASSWVGLQLCKFCSLFTDWHSQSLQNDSLGKSYVHTKFQNWPQTCTLPTPSNYSSSMVLPSTSYYVISQALLFFSCNIEKLGVAWARGYIWMCSETRSIGYFRPFLIMDGYQQHQWLCKLLLNVLHSVYAFA